MQTMEQPAHRIEDARAPLWFGSGLAAWGDVVRAVDPAATQSAAGMIAAAGLDWRVEQHPLEAVVERDSLRVAVPRHVANVRRDTRAVLGRRRGRGRAAAAVLPQRPRRRARR